MVRNYKRKTNFGATPQHIYDKAVKEVIDGIMTLRASAKKYNVNVMTLQRYKTKISDPSE